jgi:cbb3-type cytochrome oxidase maturation protein
VSILFLILPLAIGIVGVAVVAFVWAARHGQFDDTQTPAIRMLHDEDDEPPVA